ncbi:hypothetical protein BP00DRAFT_61626 [Aspergillus indologenus CBS 114.80]|uniref:Uncharacterized protein n=1 Tax=Aspergillus indologenus CBS 114.80 TaxID=1450541 RepID=A0A2V5J0C5_9EURO|nr:hypothetical protein BP00DRAFT_61626 [Aspergillus indologenus CBS 114.80]
MQGHINHMKSRALRASTSKKSAATGKHTTPSIATSRLANDRWTGRAKLSRKYAATSSDPPVSHEKILLRSSRPGPDLFRSSSGAPSYLLSSYVAFCLVCKGRCDTLLPGLWSQPTCSFYVESTCRTGCVHPIANVDYSLAMK